MAHYCKNNCGASSIPHPLENDLCDSCWEKEARKKNEYARQIVTLNIEVEGSEKDILDFKQDVTKYAMDKTYVTVISIDTDIE